MLSEWKSSSFGPALTDNVNYAPTVRSRDDNGGLQFPLFREPLALKGRPSTVPVVGFRGLVNRSVPVPGPG
jgi:hypothetical protein